MTMESKVDKFSDIRPYTDEEFASVKKRLIHNRLLISTIRMMMWKRAPKRFHKLIEILIRVFLTFRFLNIRSIDSFQKEIVGNRLLKWILKNSSDSLTSSGLEHLETSANYLFISNHRDIVLDSALVDYLLHKNGHKVPYIAFGDNLLVSEMVSDLIRINKAFIVKRNLPIKQQLKELKHLSEYINLILKEGNNIWIAQREGRAKDGVDRTNPAIIKMFHLSERKRFSDFSGFIDSIRIVPVAISYEKDPCDRLKARQLHRVSTKGSYQKKKWDDLISMAAGISGDKGRIHIAFAPPLEGKFENEKEVAIAIDQAIHSNYRLWPGNYIAFDELAEKPIYREKYSDEERTRFLVQYQNLKKEIREMLFQIYANPVKSREPSAFI